MQEREIGNPYDTYVIAVEGNISSVDSAGIVSTATRTVGHVLRIIYVDCPTNKS